ncbi:serine/threonine-protein kinase [Hamadaea sp. NPDC051192]|uniref:serine/threonine-protein kinase n=1 Tax=Hamadaea sp. NPDC051192 TaxID=3154940 RepID=UPI003423B59B
MSPSPAEPRTIAGRYRLENALGQGGMGRVWSARDEILGRDVAIKEIVPPPGLTDTERQEMRERSLREARAIARLNHPNVVRVFDVVRPESDGANGDPWIVMEYVPSRSLQDTITSDGPLPAARAAHVGLEVLHALQAAHRAGVMHRDVKPGNVLLGEDGRVVLTDFGLATVPGDPNVTRTGLVLGSPAYISPERAKEGTSGPEADLWSLGATIFAAVEGQSPYARATAIATLTALASEPPPPAKNATGPLKTVLTGLLRKDPAKRMTAEQAERLLTRAAAQAARAAVPAVAAQPEPTRLDLLRLNPGTSTSDDPPTPAPPVTPPAPPTPPRFTPRQRWYAVAASLLIVLAVAVAVPLLRDRDNQAGANGNPSATPKPSRAASASASPSAASPSAASPSAASPSAASPSVTASESGELPAGWRLFNGEDYSIPVPDGWSKSTDGGMILFREQDGLGRVLSVMSSEVTTSDPKAALAEQEGEQSSKSGYDKLKLDTVDYRGLPAADWEWLYTTGNGTHMHVLRRGVIANNRFYTFSWYVPADAWAANQDGLGVVAGGFQPRG